MRNIYIITAALLLSAATSCVMVQVHESGGTEEAAVTFRANWNGADPQHPENVKVALARRVNSIHYTYDLPGQEAGNAIRPGEYYFTAFSVQDNGTYSFSESLSAFSADPSYSMRDISASLRKMTESEISSFYGTGAGTSEDGMPYIVQAEDFFAASGPFLVSPGENVSLEMTMEDLTQEIVFILKLSPEEGVSPIRVYGDISGLAGSIRPMDRTVDHEHLCRSTIEFSRTSSESSIMEYEGRIRTLGLFPSGDAGLTDGSGTLHLLIDYSVSEGSGTQEEYLNLKSQITNAKLLEVPEDGSGYRIAADYAEIRAPKTITVRNEIQEE